MVEMRTIFVFFTHLGRVNLIGGHTDYKGGFVFPAALTMGTTIALRLLGLGKDKCDAVSYKNFVRNSGDRPKKN